MGTGGDRPPQEPAVPAWDRRAFVKFAAASAALAAAGCSTGPDIPAARVPADVAEWLVARLQEAHDPRDFGAFWDGESHPIATSADSSGTRGPYRTLADAQRDFPWVTALSDEWDGVGLRAAGAAAGEVSGVLRLPPGEGRIDQVWRPERGISVFGAGVDTSVLRLVGGGSVAFGELTESYRHGYIGDFSIRAAASSASPALSVGLVAESVFGPLRVTGARGEGVVVANAQNSEFWSWQVANCAGNGLVINGGSMNLEFSNATIKRNTGANVLIRRGDVPVPEQFSEVPRLIRFRGGLNEEPRNAGSDCFRITAGVDITFDGVQTSAGSESSPDSASVRISKERPHALQLIRLRGVQFKADAGTCLVVRGEGSQAPIQVYVSEAHFRTGTAAIEADDDAVVHLDTYYLADEVPSLLGSTNRRALSGTDSQISAAAGQGVAVVGNPSLAQFNGHPVWTMDGSTDQSVSFSVFVPASWRSFDAEVWWVVLDRGRSGEVSWRLLGGDVLAPGSDLAPATGFDAVRAPSTASPALTATTLARGLRAAGGMTTFHVSRLAQSGSGALDGAVALYALLLNRSA
jgi:hypothetical protein